MPAILGNLIVLAVLGVAIFLAARSLHKKRKSSPGCNGDCSRCGGCH